MQCDIEIERALGAVTAALNEPPLDGFDPERVQAIVDAALGGEWIADRQNPAAARSDMPVPAD
jgi:hypothetical protein